MSFGVQEKNTIHFQFHLIGYKDIAIGPQNAIQFISDNYLTTNNLSWKKYLRISVPLIALILSLRSLMNLNLFLPCLESHQKKKKCGSHVPLPTCPVLDTESYTWSRIEKARSNDIYNSNLYASNLS